MITITKTFKRVDSTIPWFQRSAEQLALIEQWVPVKFSQITTNPDEFTLVVVRTYPDSETTGQWFEQAMVIETERQRKIYEDAHGITWTKTVIDDVAVTTVTTTS